jgi:hypothetical protein
MIAIDDALLREPNLLVPHKKPVGPVKIDADHWAGKHCKTLYMMTEGGTDLINLYNDDRARPSGAGLNKIVTKKGIAVEKSVDDDENYVVDNPYVFDGDKMTLLCIFKSDTTSEFQNMVLGENDATDGGHLYLRYNVYSQHYWDGQIWKGETSTLKYSDTEYHTHAMTTNALGQRVFFVDRDYETIADTHAAGQTFTSKYIGTGRSAGQGMLGYMPLIAMFSERFSINQMLDLISDPYQFITPA